MFEGFSFSSCSSRRNAILPVEHGEGVAQCDSNLVSPLSSRCPSPGLLSPSSADLARFSNKRRSRSQFHHHHASPAPTSIPSSYIDQQQQHRLSIGSLTQRLHVHSLKNTSGNTNDRMDAENDQGFPATPPRSSPTDSDDLDMPTAGAPTITTTSWPDHCSVEPLIPPETDRDDDSAWLEGPSPTSTPRFSQSRNPSLSFPQPSHAGNSTSTVAHQTAHDIRQQRETLSILQSSTSTVGETLSLAVLLDDRFLDNEHHPSSLPPPRSQRTSQPQSRNFPPSSLSRSSSQSKLGPTSRKSRIDKSHYTSSSSGSGASGNFSSASLFSCQGLGLRRKSMVLAAVSTVLENEAIAANQHRRSSNGLLSPRSSPDTQVPPGRRRSHASPSKTQSQ